MAKEADLFAEARGGVHTCTNKGQRVNRGAAQNHSKPDVNKGGRKQEIKWGICGKGHLTIKCYKNPNRMSGHKFSPEWIAVKATGKSVFRITVSI